MFAFLSLNGPWSRLPFHNVIFFVYFLYGFFISFIGWTMTSPPPPIGFKFFIRWTLTPHPVLALLFQLFFKRFNFLVINIHWAGKEINVVGYIEIVMIKTYKSKLKRADLGSFKHDIKEQNTLFFRNVSDYNVTSTFSFNWIKSQTLSIHNFMLWTWYFYVVRIINKQVWHNSCTDI